MQPFDPSQRGLPPIKSALLPSPVRSIRDTPSGPLSLRVILAEATDTTALASQGRSPDADEQTGRHAYRLLMTARETVVIGWFQVPAKAVLSRWPEHEVSS
jgi:hypothetical protein